MYDDDRSTPQDEANSLSVAIEKAGLVSRGRIHIAPDIPQKQLGNALQTYGLKPGAQDIVVLIDDTMLGSGKDGCLLCEDKLIVRESFSEPKFIDYASVKSLSVNGSKIAINGSRTFSFQMPTASDMGAVFLVLSQWISTRHGRASTESVERSAQSVEAPSLERVRNNLELTILRFRDIFRFLEKDKARHIAEHAMEYFAALKESLQKKEFITEIQAESDLIHSLCDHFMEVSYKREALKPKLMQVSPDDSPLVNVLRRMLHQVKEMDEEDQMKDEQARKNASIDDFMR
jgi:hypothetical protein